MASTDTQCPQCGSRRIVFGELTQGRVMGWSAPYAFRAFAARLSSMRSGVKIRSQMCACSSCGLVWGQIAPNQLIDHLDKFATDDARHWLSSGNDTPL
ncbi:hypothetical protein BH11GEM1_BH11GEM1_33210 [soil metagenome]